jgi:hypothetical protein
MPQTFSFDPSAVHQVLADYDIPGHLVISEEPELEPHTIELESDFSVVFRNEMSLEQVRNGKVIDHGEFRSINELVENIRESLE